MCFFSFKIVGSLELGSQSNFPTHSTILDFVPKKSTVPYCVNNIFCDFIFASNNQILRSRLALNEFPIVLVFCTVVKRNINIQATSEFLVASFLCYGIRSYWLIILCCSEPCFREKLFAHQVVFVISQQTGKLRDSR